MDQPSLDQPSAAASRNQAIAALNALLRCEIAALERYETVLARGRSGIGWCGWWIVADCRASHDLRVHSLIARIDALGGLPADSGPLADGDLASPAATTARSARLRAVRELGADEDHVLSTYEDALFRLDPESRQLVERELLPEQRSTCHAVHHHASAW